MSTTLRWQDVAGQVRGPDYTDSAAMITRGIEGIGQSVSTLGGQGDARRKEQRDQENKVLALQLGFADKNAKQVGDFGKDLRAFNKEEDMKEFGAAQSALESLTRTTIANGGTMDDVFNSEIYRNLGEGARSYGASHLSDAGYQGDQMRIRAEENRQQQANADRSYGLQLASHRESAAARREASEERRRARAEDDASKPRVWRTGNAKTDRALTELERTTGARYNEASGAAYAGMTIAEMGKNHENLEGVTSLFKSFNDARVAKGAEALPDTVLMKILDSATGSKSNWATGVDDSGILNVMSAAGRQFDVANKGRMYALNVTNNALNDPSYRPDQAGIDRGFNQLYNGKPPKDAAPPAAVPARAIPAAAPRPAAVTAPASPEVAAVFEQRLRNLAKQKEDAAKRKADGERLSAYIDTLPGPAPKAVTDYGTVEEMMAERERRLRNK